MLMPPNLIPNLGAIPFQIHITQVGEIIQILGGNKARIRISSLMAQHHSLDSSRLVFLFSRVVNLGFHPLLKHITNLPILLLLLRITLPWRVK
jgi:hypothetical protein